MPRSVLQTLMKPQVRDHEISRLWASSRLDLQVSPQLRGAVPTPPRKLADIPEQSSQSRVQGELLSGSASRKSQLQCACLTPHVPLPPQLPVGQRGLEQHVCTGSGQKAGLPRCPGRPVVPGRRRRHRLLPGRGSQPSPQPGRLHSMAVLGEPGNPTFVLDPQRSQSPFQTGPAQTWPCL